MIGGGCVWEGRSPSLNLHSISETSSTHLCVHVCACVVACV